MTLTTTIAAALHEGCIEDWRRAVWYGANSITQHDLTAHIPDAERVAAALAPLVALVPEDPWTRAQSGRLECYRCRWAYRNDHAPDCAWSAARALLEGRE